MDYKLYNTESLPVLLARAQAKLADLEAEVEAAKAEVATIEAEVASRPVLPPEQPRESKPTDFDQAG